MEITVWGCRGSLPTPGHETVHYGGNTTCVEIRLQGGEVIIFDAGSGIRPLGKKLQKERDLSQLDLVLSHAHWDHLMGFPFFGPAYSDKFSINVRGGPTVKKYLRGYLQEQMKTPFFPVPFDAMSARFDFSTGDPKSRSLGNATLSPIRMSHPNTCYGFKVSEEGKTFIFFTDHEIGHSHPHALQRKDYIDFCLGADLLFHDAQYTVEQYQTTVGWGHSTIPDAVNFAIDASVKRLGLFHHDPDHNDDQIADLESSARQKARSVGPELECFAVREGMTITL
jgi:phosphoribosyl 1,2-cyclic phosphodiesterase